MLFRSDERGRPPPSGTTTGLCASAFLGVLSRALAGRAVLAAGCVRRQRLRRSRDREAQAALPSVVGLSPEFLPWTSRVRPRPAGQDARDRPTRPRLSLCSQGSETSPATPPAPPLPAQGPHRGSRHGPQLSGPLRTPTPPAAAPSPSPTGSAQGAALCASCPPPQGGLGALCSWRNSPGPELCGRFPGGTSGKESACRRHGFNP